MPNAHATESDEAVVRRYLTALGNGQVLEALNIFSLDARIRDEAGRERRGIREIAAAFARHERPVRVEIEDVAREGDEVAVRLRMTFCEGHEPREYRSVFRVRRERIRSLETVPLPAPRRHTRRAPSA